MCSVCIIGDIFFKDVERWLDSIPNVGTLTIRVTEYVESAGAHCKTVHNATTDRKSTNKWLTDGKLQSETEALVVAISYSYLNRILKRKCGP